MTGHVGRANSPADISAKSIANALGISGYGRWHSYDNLLDWAVKQYWRNRPVQKVQDVA